MLERITPLILAYNEAPNIGRVLDRLAWAKRIVVVDSGSTDGTAEILAQRANVAVYTRPFDRHADQWNFGLRETGIDTDWVLALDADYVLSEALIEELRSLSPPTDSAGFRARFRYCIGGEPIRSGAYPPVVVLYRRDGAEYVQDGHTQRVRVPGRIEALTATIDHDDRKPLGRWLDSQKAYARLEADHLQTATVAALGRVDRLRRWGWIVPPLMFLYTFVWRLGFLDGRAGLYYAAQRTYAELLLALELLDRRLLPGGRNEPAGPEPISGKRP